MASISIHNANNVSLPRGQTSLTRPLAAVREAVASQALLPSPSSTFPLAPIAFLVKEYSLPLTTSPSSNKWRMMTSEAWCRMLSLMVMSPSPSPSSQSNLSLPLAKLKLTSKSTKLSTNNLQAYQSSRSLCKRTQ